MRNLSLGELAAPLEAVLRGADCEISGVSTDSRCLCAGDLFVALRGEHFDGHDFLPRVEAAGAAAALVSADVDSVLPTLRVADTQRALGLLGAFNRALYQGPLVAITGSSGKTTVKNMVHAVLSQSGETLATEGNFNNEIGVPLTLLRLSQGVDYAVIEMGAARAGDIRWLCELGNPSVAILLNAMPAHLEGFGSVESAWNRQRRSVPGISRSGASMGPFSPPPRRRAKSSSAWHCPADITWPMLWRQ
jgi:UDP-N-acetylmuramoyl-tripeptide--D-alanyl-D-alanine ligase